jgi:peroxiredoxin
MTRRALLLFGTTLLILPPAALPAQQPAARPPANLPAGHSMHGEAFNEGPRQKAYLMGGTGKVHLAVTTKSKEAQAFFDQGIGQLHGFWYFEAERTFRQVNLLDPDCTMAYWGMAMANVNNPGRAKAFIQKAVEKKAKASPREQRWIDAYAAYWGGKKDEKARRQDLVVALENIAYEFPSEIEARAFLGFQLWDNSNHGIANPSRLAVDAVLRQVLAVEPMHPVHHYRIHLWDGPQAARALDSAAMDGPSGPAIAHLWHMSGHTYVRLKRYADAAWAQEASARVDHRHMMHDRVMPDEIFNYAHNNQWLVEDLEYIGRAHDAVALAKNLIELPRHPRYNVLGGRGSSGEGRRRLVETLLRYELWDETIALADTMYLEPTDLPAEQVKRLHALGLAWFGKGNAAKGRDQIHALEEMLPKAPAKGKTGGNRGRRAKGADRRTVESALAELRVWSALADGDRAKTAEMLKKANDVPKERQVRLWLKAGDADRAETLARQSVAEGQNQVQRLAEYVAVLQERGKTKEAKEQFDKLRPLCAQADLDVPVMRRIRPTAKALGLADDWRPPLKWSDDVGKRPDLRTLGPVHWQPSPAPDWTLPGVSGKTVALKDYRGRPLLVIFYLGHGCPHCMEQLTKFAPLLPDYGAAGISVVAISSDPPKGLEKTFERSKVPADFTLASDETLKTFKAYRAYDDFEDTPLHGTFLIDADGLVRWQDISYEPFTDPRFLLTEAKRLLSLPTAGVDRRSVRAAP